MLKTCVRCVLASAAAIVLLVNKATLATIGQAGFFAAIISILLSVSVLASLTLLIGMLLGWAWGAACMAAAISVQDKALLAARLAAAQKGLVAGIPPALQLQSLAFHGAFLDHRTSAVYGAMFFLGTFAMGVLRARMPKLALMGIGIAPALQVRYLHPLSPSPLSSCFVSSPPSHPSCLPCPPFPTRCRKDIATPAQRSGWTVQSDAGSYISQKIPIA